MIVVCCTYFLSALELLFLLTYIPYSSWMKKEVVGGAGKEIIHGTLFEFQML